MKNAVWIVGLLLIACSWGSAQEAVPKISEDVPSVEVQIPASPDLNLEIAVAEGVAYSDYGAVVVLNNGIVVLEHLDLLEVGDLGAIQVVSEVAAVQLPVLKEVDALEALLSFGNVSFDVIWDEDGAAGLIVVQTEFMWMELDIVPLTAVTGPTCAVTCPNGGDGEDASCSITCPTNKAALCYCSGPTPMCACVGKPKNGYQTGDCTTS